jgi:tetratricopeptide (TPR) repeat protein
MSLSSASILGFLDWPGTPRYTLDENDARAFANAMNTLRLYARNFDSSRGLPPVCLADKEEKDHIFAEFQKRAAAWRALPARPPLSDAVRKQQLLAEDAVNQKQFETAAAAYDAGTQIDPMWPEGHFNAAAIYGELKDYDDAVWHMRCYLELMPNAPDAKTARDQMLLWQAKAEQQAVAQ